MSSKFFTWGHRGDKKTSPYGIVPIPAECITIHGIDAKSPNKTRRKPLPLDLYQAPDTTINKRSRASDSVALHDAAVQSATSLLAVINDCLKSPPLSAHLMSAQQQQPGLQPMHGRPRSHTAPSTPMAEVPSVRPTSPVELPGFMPVTRSHVTHQSMDGRALQSIMKAPVENSSLRHSIERSHSSPQESCHKFPVYPRQLSDSLPRSVASLQPPLDPIPRARTGSPHQRLRSKTPAAFNGSDDTLVGSESEQSSLAMKRPPLGIFSGCHSSSPGALSYKSGSQFNSSVSIPQLPLDEANNSCTERDNKMSLDPESILMGQLSTLRAAHEAHLTSLKESHEKELASHRSYVSFLENRIAAQSAANQSFKQHLTIDTSHATNKDASLLSSDASATNSMQSFELTLEKQKRASSEAAAEAQKLRRERDQLKDSLERNERRVSQLRGIVRKAKENENALKNAISGLEASLLAANNERLDVLEGFHEACEQLRIIGKQRDDYRSRLSSTGPVTTPDQKPPPQKDPQEIMQRTTSLRRDILLQKVDELRQTLSERAMRIEELERQVSNARPADNDSQDDTKAAMEARLKQREQQLAAAQADRDRYDSLLHSELRRQSRLAAPKAHTATPQLETQALSAMRERLNALKDTSNVSSTTASEEPLRTSTLEKELEFCFREIIMYKLDIKGYKKDLKLANVEIDMLRSQQQAKSSSGERVQPAPGSGVSSRTTDAMSVQQRASSSGLGISMPAAPTTLQHSKGSASTSARLSTTSTPQNAPPTPPRPKTPSGVHKKLPKPPPQSRTPSPYPPNSPPRTDIHRQETLRSLSESIISSYAKRGTPEQETPSPPRGRSSDPPRMSGETKAVPMAKFTPRTLRASGRVVGVAAT